MMQKTNPTWARVVQIYMYVVFASPCRVAALPRSSGAFHLDSSAQTYSLMRPVFPSFYWAHHDYRLPGSEMQVPISKGEAVRKKKKKRR